MKVKHKQVLQLSMINMKSNWTHWISNKIFHTNMWIGGTYIDSQWNTLPEKCWWTFELTRKTNQIRTRTLVLVPFICLYDDFFRLAFFFSSARASIRKSRLSIGNGKNWFEFSKHIEYIAFNADSVFQTDCRQIAIFLSTRGKVSAYPHRWLTLCVQIYGNSKYKSQQDFNIKYSFGLQSARSDLYYNR